MVKSMTSLLRRFPSTCVALAFAFIVLAIGLFANIDVFELPQVVIPGIAPTEMGEIVTAFVLAIPAFFVDHIVARQRAVDRQTVLLLTMRTVQDIVNNNLNQLQLLRLEAEGLVPDETLRLFDSALQDTAARLTALGNMTVFTHTHTENGSSLEIRAPSAPH